MKHTHKKQRRLNYTAIFLKMRKNKWTQREVAKKIGKTPSAICYALKGEMPSLLPAINNVVNKPFNKEAA
jgi:transcriptional regulator with XRE-family HTH domain